MLEIRRNIYRLLLLEPRSASLDPDHWAMTHGRFYDLLTPYSDPSKPSTIYTEFAGISSSYRNNGWSDDDASGFDELGPIKPTASDQRNIQVKWDRKQELLKEIADGMDAAKQRTPAILQTNRQIYNEASSVLYSELQLVVRPGDALTEVSEAFVKGSEDVWRHLPSEGFGRKNATGQTIYDTSEMKGAMEPHVFKRFQRVRYEAEFEYRETDSAPHIFIDRESRISNREETRLITHLKSATACNLAPVQIVQEFVNLIKNSPRIEHLEVALGVQLEPDFGSGDESWGPESDVHLDPKHEAKNELLNKRAYELLLEIGVFEPLKNLRNVYYFDFDLAFVNHLPQRILFQPKQKHIDIIDDLKGTIEFYYLDSSQSDS